MYQTKLNESLIEILNSDKFLEQTKYEKANFLRTLRDVAKKKSRLRLSEKELTRRREKVEIIDYYCEENRIDLFNLELNNIQFLEDKKGQLKLIFQGDFKVVKSKIEELEKSIKKAESRIDWIQEELFKKQGIDVAFQRWVDELESYLSISSGIVEEILDEINQEGL